MPKVTLQRPVRIAILCKRDSDEDFVPYNMAQTRWLRISEALARLGYHVDMILNTPAGVVEKAPRLRFVPLATARWHEYDVVKTEYQSGFEALVSAGAGQHPFIIGRLGTVIGRDDSNGVFFFGRERELLYRLQERISLQCRYVALLSQTEAAFFARLHGRREGLVVVPTGVDAIIPAPRRNPYAAFRERIAVYIGNIRGRLSTFEAENGAAIDILSQTDLNRQWQERLNAVGGLLRKQGIRLCFLGLGNVSQLDPAKVTVFDPAPNDDIWDYHYFADVGIALAQGTPQYAECSKIYYYLRAGLPVVSEAPIPTNALINETDHGLIVDYGDDQAMAMAVVEAVRRRWDKTAAMDTMVKQHTWDARARVYDALLRRELGLDNVYQEQEIGR